MAAQADRDSRADAADRRRFARGVAPGVSERHELACGLSRGLRRGQCTCTPSYWARVTDRRGQRQLATLRTLAEAVAWVEVTRNRPASDNSREAGLPTSGRSAQGITVGDAARWFLERAVAAQLVNRSGKRYSEATLRSYETQLRRRVLPCVEPKSGSRIAELPLDELTNRVAQALANEIAASASAATTRTAIAALQAVMREAYEAGVTEMERPTRLRLPSPPRPRQRVLLPEEVQSLLEAARIDDERFSRSFAVPLVRLLSRTGARVSEVLVLEWGARGLALRSDSPVMRIGASKTEAGVRDIWLDAETAKILRAHWAATGKPPDGSPVFRRRDGARADRFGIARATIRRVAKAAGVADVSPHVFRHTHVTQLVADGASIVDVAARVGHADARHTLSLYAKPTRAGQARIVRLLERG